MTRFFKALGGTALLVVLALALGTLVQPVERALAAYGAVLLNDGTNTWMVTTNANNQLVFSDNGGSNTFAVDATTGPVVSNSFTVATLPTCNAARLGSLVIVTDATTPTYNGALTGGSTVKVPAFCTGAAWLSH